MQLRPCASQVPRYWSQEDTPLAHSGGCSYAPAQARCPLLEPKGHPASALRRMQLRPCASQVPRYWSQEDTPLAHSGGCSYAPAQARCPLLEPKGHPASALRRMQLRPCASQVPRYWSQEDTPLAHSVRCSYTPAQARWPATGVKRTPH
ncbi:hypothetical protein NDU88_004908 [Pleurodeles waltl]|uniref:Uncharacterized protein n=1 Tax=Pleurodeles waltl TaxID=8319 RepID=A0AAV7V2J0_PLEWA|nr:hypothetical protein NDU88_004908 [Pleurodeles waltl]